MIENATVKPGQPRARISCDHPGCARTDVFPCPRCFDTSKHPRDIIDEGAAKRKSTERGWRVVGKRLLCPEHAASERHQETREEPLTKDETAEALRRPTMAQKRQIMTLLGEVYDIDAGHYIGAETDLTVAETIGGGCMFGWVAELREEFFGPVGGNQELESIASDLAGQRELIRSTLSSLGEQQAIIEKAAADVLILTRRLDALKATLGPKARRS